MSNTIERFWQETERFLSEPREPRETREDRENEDFLRHLDKVDMERAADRIEELSAGYVDWRGIPMEGFESPRFLTERERSYMQWHRSSPLAANVRRIRGGAA